MIDKPFHPPLVAAFFILSVYSSNMDMVPLVHLWIPLGVAFIGAVSVWGLAALCWRDISRGAVFASVFLVFFACYAVFEPNLKRFSWLGPPLALWAFITLTVAALASWKGVWTKFWNTLSLAVVLVAILQAGWTQIRSTHTNGPVAAGRLSTSIPVTELPDVYYIVLDGFGRTDQLERVMGFSDSDFVKSLESRGFYVASAARSNYCQTELSVASSLNLDYITNLVPDASPLASDRAALERLINDNAVYREFKSLGYTTVAVTSGFPPIRLEAAENHLDNIDGTTLIESALIQATPFKVSVPAQMSMFEERRRYLHRSIDELQNIGPRQARPRVVIAHVLAPHPPFVFDAQGRSTKSNGLFGYWDGSDFMTFAGTKDDYRTGYRGQAQYIAMRMIETIDKILAEPGPSPIIILQGDHGSKLNLDQNDMSKTDLDEVFSILLAARVPETVRAQLYPTMSPVNVFRLVFQGLFGSDLPVLPDKSSYSPYSHPYEFTDVTGLLKPGPAH